MQIICTSGFPNARRVTSRSHPLLSSPREMSEAARCDLYAIDRWDLAESNCQLLTTNRKKNREVITRKELAFGVAKPVTLGAKCTTPLPFWGRNYPTLRQPPPPWRPRCRDWLQGNCPRGPECFFTHNPEVCTSRTVLCDVALISAFPRYEQWKSLTRGGVLK